MEKSILLVLCLLASTQCAVIQSIFGMSNPMTISKRSINSTSSSKGMVYLPIPTNEVAAAITTLKTTLMTNLDCTVSSDIQQKISALQKTNTLSSIFIYGISVYPYNFSVLDLFSIVFEPKQLIKQVKDSWFSKYSS